MAGAISDVSVTILRRLAEKLGNRLVYGFGIAGEESCSWGDACNLESHFSSFCPPIARRAGLVWFKFGSSNRMISVRRPVGLP